MIFSANTEVSVWKISKNACLAACFALFRGFTQGIMNNIPNFVPNYYLI